MNPQVDAYLADGCGRCSLYNTPDCKVHAWHKELVELRSILLECGLIEELKWSQPCYTFQKKNILILGAFKDHCVLSFFKGSLLKDELNLLSKPGENSQAGRFFKFTNVKDIIRLKDTIKAYIFEAIEVEKAGLKVAFKKIDEQDIPDELQYIFENDSVFQNAFRSLTPGRQRGYLLFFSAAKQSKTRVSRIEKYRPKIMDGKGMHD